MTSSNHISIQDRINSLSEAQQLLLAEKLGFSPDSQEADALAAFIVSRSGADANLLQTAIKERLADYMQPEVVLVDDLPRTPNGKIDRRELLKSGVRRSGSMQSNSVTPGTVQQKLIDIWQIVLGVENIKVDDNFFELGGDSIRAMQVISRARAVGIRLSVKQLFAQPTIEELSPEEMIAPETVDKPPVSGEFVLSPIQQWFFRENFAERNHWNQSALITLSTDDSPETVRKALERLADHHEALRLSFIEENDQIWQLAAEKPMVNLSVRHFSSSEELDAMVHLVQKELDISKPDGAWQAVYFKSDEATDNRLLLVVHHLLIDGVSWSVLLEDLSTLLKAPPTESTTTLLPKSVTLPEWNDALWRLANKRETHNQVANWLAENSQSSGKLALPDQADMSVNTEGNIKKVVLELSEMETAQLQKDSKSVFRSNLNELLLATLFHTLLPWTKRSSFRLNMEGHGREEGFGKDASRAVGWFTGFFPLMVEPGGNRLPEAISAVKQALADLPVNGLAVSAAQYLSHSETLRKSIDEAMQNDVLYNYLGTLDAEYGNDMDYRLISSRSPLAHRSHLLEVTAYVLNARLQLQWDYCPDLHDAATIERLAKTQLAGLRSLLGYEMQESAGFSPADFPLADLDKPVLKKIAALLTEIDAGEELR